MRLMLTTLCVFAAVAAALPARDAADDHRAARRATEPDRTDRLKQYVAAFRTLSPDVQDRVRLLDKEMQEEDAATRARLTGVMERYALWMSRLKDADRKRVEAAPAGPERLHVVRAVMEQQWLEALPPARKEQFAKGTDTERKSLIGRWHQEDRDRTQEWALSLRSAQEMAMLSRDERMKTFREDVAKFAKTVLEPKLTQKEKTRFQAIKVPGSPNYFRQVLALSEAHKLNPPGPPDIWDRFREPRK